MPKKARVVLLIVVLAIGFGVWRWKSGNGDNGALTASGTIEATELDLSPRIGGRIVQISVDEGAKVTKGEVIATLSAPEVEAREPKVKVLPTIPLGNSLEGSRPVAALAMT